METSIKLSNSLTVSAILFGCTDLAHLRSRKNVYLALHGWLDNAATFNHFAPALCEAYAEEEVCVLAVDLVGYGRSEHRHLSANINILDHIADMADLVQVLGLKRVHLLGHSMGGVICALLASIYPDMVSSLILLDSLGPFSAPADDAVRTARRGIDAIIRRNRQLAGASLMLNGATTTPSTPLSAVADLTSPTTPTPASATGNPRFVTSPSLLPSQQSSQATPVAATTGAPMPKQDALGRRLFPNFAAVVKRLMETYTGGLSERGATALASRGTVPVYLGTEMDASSQVPSVYECDVTTNGFALRFSYDMRHLDQSPYRLVEEQVQAFLKGVQCPTLLLWATNGWPYDQAIMAARQAVMVRYTHTQVHVIDGNHHYHLDEQPGMEALNIIHVWMEKRGVLLSSAPTSGTGRTILSQPMSIAASQSPMSQTLASLSQQD